MSKAGRNLDVTPEKAIPTPNKRRIAMRSFWKHSLLLACVGLMLAAPLPAFAVQPDMYVNISPLVDVTHLKPVALPQPPSLQIPVEKEVWKVDVWVGNAGPVPPVQDTIALFTVSAGGNQVCSKGIPDMQHKLPPGANFKAFSFQVTYLAGSVTKTTPTVHYQVQAEVKYSQTPCLIGQNESNCANNIKTTSFPFPAGGAVGCGLTQ